MNLWSRFSAMALAAVTGVIVWSSGCGPGDERYYCDNTGCYSCDGYGCRNVNPPGNSPCTGNTSCPSGSVCTDKGCVQTCSTDADCPHGTVCNANQCVAPGQTGGNVKECTTNAECKAGQQCQNNTCVAAPDGGSGCVKQSSPSASSGCDPEKEDLYTCQGSDQPAGSCRPSAQPGSFCCLKPPPECTKGSDCGDGKACEQGKCQACGGAAGPCQCAQQSDCGGNLTCSGGICQPPGDVCKYNSDCTPGVCADGRCEAACGPSNACPNGYTCVKGACDKNPTGNSCTSNGQCSAPTPFCVGGHCAAGCTNDQQCGAGNYCDQGACAPDTRPKGNCQSDTQCNTAAGQKCVQGICKYPCSDDNQCKLIDVRIGYCGADKVCRSYAEAHPQCTTKAECSSPQDCIGNVCQ
jgi:Cys-rich repeat protein